MVYTPETEHGERWAAEPSCPVSKPGSCELVSRIHLSQWLTCVTYVPFQGHSVGKVVLSCSCPTGLTAYGPSADIPSLMLLRVYLMASKHVIQAHTETPSDATDRANSCPAAAHLRHCPPSHYCPGV